MTIAMTTKYFSLGDKSDFGLRARSAVALPPGRSPNAFAMKWQSNHQKHPFQSKKEIRRGEISKNKAKGFSGGASAGLPAQALGLSLHGSAILLKIGSDLVVKSHQINN